MIILPHDATVSATTSLTAPKPPSEGGSVGRGEIHAATWDEFPNGRFGDFKSPAYGMQDLWDASSGLGVKVHLRYPGGEWVVDVSQ